MIGTVERIKNNVLLKCSTLNDDIIAKDLINIIDTRIYRFSEEMVSMVTDINIEEENLRNKITELIKNLIIKKIKRKIFIDSLALQVTNDTFIEDYVNEKITIDKLKKEYVFELNNNKTSNQLNMTEDLDLSEIFKSVTKYVESEIINKVSENLTLTNSINKLVINFKVELEKDLQKMIDDLNNDYLNILINELHEVIDDKDKKEERVDNMEKDINTEVINEKLSNFDKYDDMTLFNKVTLCLNTEEEKLSREESKIEEEKKQIEERLNATNKNIEANIERENKLSQRKLELSNKEIELNSKLSETEVIFLNIKPLIKGLSKIKETGVDGGNENE